MKIGNNLDLDYTQLQNALLQNLTSNPTGVQNSRKGQIYFDTGVSKPRYWDGTTWRTIIDDRANGITEAMIASSSKWNAKQDAIEDVADSVSGYVSKVTQTDGQITVSHASFATPTVAWTGGTSAGPTLKITTDGGTSSTEAIPSATGSASGIVTTGTQTFGGQKTFSSVAVFSGGLKVAASKAVSFNGGGADSGTGIIPYMEYDAVNHAIHFSCGIYSDQFVSSGGIGTSSTGTGGGLIQECFSTDDWSGTYTKSDYTNTFNAYAIQQLYNQVQQLANLPKGVVFMGSLGTGGTATTLPAASSSNDGYQYKVITAGTYQGVAAKVGDLLISNGSAWILIPSGDEPSGTVTSVKVTVPTGLTVTGSPITSSGTIAIGLASGYSIPTTSKQAEWTAKQSALTAGTGITISGSTISVTPSTYQPLDADLTAIAALSGTSGLLKKTAANTWALDTTAYLSAATLIHSYTIASGSTTYTTTTNFTSKNLVAVVYDSNGEQVLTDVAIVTANSKHNIKVTFARALTAAYTLVVYGV